MLGVSKSITPGPAMYSTVDYGSIAGRVQKKISIVNQDARKNDELKRIMKEDAAIEYATPGPGDYRAAESHSALKPKQQFSIISRAL